MAHPEVVHQCCEALDVEGIPPSALNTKLRADLIYRWVMAVGDPDAGDIHNWLTQGNTNYTGNYTSVDDDPAAEVEVKRFWRAASWAGGQLCLSKLDLITQVHPVTGRVKRRLILDCKESTVNEHAWKGGRLLLPRAADVLDDTLGLLRQVEGTSAQVEWLLVLDYSDWFFQVPLHPKERRHFAFASKGKFAVYLVQAQGSINAPFVCGRVAALIARLTQGAFGTEILKLQIYVDDPCISVCGLDRQRDVNLAILILMWRALGIKLAFKKADRGQPVQWIGTTLQLEKVGTASAKVIVTAKERLIEELRASTTRHLRVNLISTKELNTYVRKLNYLAGIVEIVRPYLSDVYAALLSKDGMASNAPRGMVWTKQWRHASLWLQALLGDQGKLTRVYRMATYFGRGIKLKLVNDASPYGLGAVLFLEDKLVRYFASTIRTPPFWPLRKAPRLLSKLWRLQRSCRPSRPGGIGGPEARLLLRVGLHQHAVSGEQASHKQSWHC